MSTDRKPRVHFGRPLIGFREKEAVHEVLGKKTLTNGAQVRLFEESFQEFTGGFACAVSSCTSALYIGCQMFFKPGDEVIVPANGHLSAPNAVKLSGATPVFCDINRATGNIDVNCVKAVISDKTRGIIAIHYLGIPCELRSLTNFCIENNLFLIEDCALALGTSYEGRHVGLWGDLGTFSFYPTKHITTGEGGMLLTSNIGILEEAKRLRSFGQAERYGDIASPGLNFRMTEIQAAIGQEQMKRLPVFLKQRNHNLNRLSSGLSGFERVGGSYGMTIFPEVDRNELRKRLLNEFVESSVYYPRPLPSLSYYQPSESFPVAESFCHESLCLPIGPHLSDRHTRHIVESFRKCVSQLSVAPASSAII